jgi:hypothetical protein
MEQQKFRMPIRKGTLEIYNAMPVKDAGTIYILTDVTDGNNIFLGEIPLGGGGGGSMQKVIKYVLFDKDSQIFTFAYADGTSEVVDMVLGVDGVQDGNIQSILASLEASNAITTAKLNETIATLQQLSAAVLTQTGVTGQVVAGQVIAGQTQALSEAEAALINGFATATSEVVAMLQEMFFMANLATTEQAEGTQESALLSGLVAAEDRAKLNELIALVQEIKTSGVPTNGAPVSMPVTPPETPLAQQNPSEAYTSTTSVTTFSLPASTTDESIPAVMELTYPKKIIYGQRARLRITHRLLPVGSNQQIIFLPCNDVITVKSDGEIVANKPGSCKIYVAPAWNPGIFETIEILVIAHAFRKFSSNSLRLTGNGKLHII